MITNHNIKSGKPSFLQLLLGVPLLLSVMMVSLSGCIDAGRNCEESAEFIAFEKLVDDFSAISSRSDCFELQQAARGILANTEGCSDKLIIEASASGWLVIDCSKWIGLGD